MNERAHAPTHTATPLRAIYLAQRGGPRRVCALCWHQQEEDESKSSLHIGFHSMSGSPIAFTASGEQERPGNLASCAFARACMRGAAGAPMFTRRLTVERKLGRSPP